MTVKAPSRLQALSHARRIPHAPRRIHQVVARPPPSRPTSVSNDDYLRALYRDLMRPGVDLQKVSEHLNITSPVPDNIPSKTDNTIDTLLAEYAKQGNARNFDLLVSSMLSAPPTEQQRDLHVKAHIVNASP
ncbi:hypothetical protein OG21DRAFT_1486879 [Imleria badia]|nr:hypothetical protein OG21DRAFT_1486879 [Imleria badia]